MTIMLLVLIGLVLGVIYLFVEYHYEEQRDFNFDNWLRMKYQPDWSPEKEAEEQLQDILSDAENHWKRYM